MGKQARRGGGLDGARTLPLGRRATVEGRAVQGGGLAMKCGLPHAAGGVHVFVWDMVCVASAAIECARIARLWKRLPGLTLIWFPAGV